MNEEFNEVKRSFESGNILLSNDWLQSCLEWIHGEKPNENIPVLAITRTVYEQWLLLDLRDVELGILPPQLSEKDKYTLNGNFALQLMKIIDISKPKLWQLHKIRNKNSEIRIGEQKDTNTSGRMLQLTLTDGVQEVEAIEYTAISKLNINLVPGSKVMIMGPVMVRRGQIMLSEVNVVVLGGEVEELLVVNAPENVMARHLNLPETQTPFTVNETERVSNNNLDNDVNVINGIGALIAPVAAQTAREAIPDDFFSDEDELQMIAAVDSLMEVENEMQSRQISPPKPNANESGDKTATTSLSDDGSIFADMDIDAHLDQIDKQIAEKSAKVKGYMSIANLLKIRPNLTTGKFKVKAKFKAITQKLTVDNDLWSIRLIFEDETGEIEVSLHSDIVSTLIGYCPSAMMSLKQDIVNKDSCAMLKVFKAIEDLKKKIVELDGVIEIFFKNKETVPEVIQLL